MSRTSCTGIPGVSATRAQHHGKWMLLIRVAAPKGFKQQRKYFDLPTPDYDPKVKPLPLRIKQWALEKVRKAEPVTKNGAVLFEAVTKEWADIQLGAGHNADNIRLSQALATYCFRQGADRLDERGFGAAVFQAIAGLKRNDLRLDGKGGQDAARPLSNEYRNGLLRKVAAIVAYAIDREYIAKSPLLYVRARGRRVLRTFEADETLEPIFTLAELRQLVGKAGQFPHRAKQEACRAAVERHGGNFACRSASMVAAGKELGMHPDTLDRILSQDVGAEDPWWLPFCIMIYTGMRAQEAMHLRWENIDWDASVIKLRAWKDPATGVCPFDLKTGERNVPMMDELREILQKRAKTSGWIIDNQAMRERGTCLRLRECKKAPRDYGPGFALFLKRVGVPVNGRHPHSTRHCYASLRRAKGDFPEDIQRALGHAAYETTAEYAKQSDSYERGVRQWPAGEFVLRRELLPVGKADTDAELFVLEDEEDAA